jgi:chromate transporter
MMLTLSLTDWIHLFLHFSSLSLLAVGGGISLVPGMHQYLVLQQAWLTDSQFASSVALAQIAPGPNVLFVALMGWNVGVNAGGVHLALLGALLCLLGIVLPSSVLTLYATRWARRNQQHRVVRAFKQGMTPLVVALLMSSAWVLATPSMTTDTPWTFWVLGVTALWVLWRTKIHLLWVLLAGAVLGAIG